MGTWEGGGRGGGPINLDDNRAGAYCAWRRCGRECLFPFSLCLSGRQPDIDLNKNQRAFIPKTTISIRQIF